LAESDADDSLMPIALVSKAHGSEYFESAVSELQENVHHPAGKPIRGDLLAALLMMGDEIDLHRSRARLPDDSIRYPPLSLLHHYKHIYVSSVAVLDGKSRLDRQTVVGFLFPPQARGSYDKDLTAWVVNKIEEQANRTQNILVSATEGQLRWDERPVVAKIWYDKFGVREALPGEVLAVLKWQLEEDPAVKHRRIDAAAPSYAKVGQHIDLFVQVRFPDSPLLGIEDWPTKQKPSSIEQASEPVALKFPVDRQTGKPGSARLKIRVVAPDFAIEGAAQQLVEVPPDQYSKCIAFLLTAKKAGSCKIDVEVYSTDHIYLGTIPVETTVGGMDITSTEIVVSLVLFVKVELTEVPSGVSVHKDEEREEQAADAKPSVSVQGAVGKPSESLETSTRLREVLICLYPTQQDSRRVVEDAGLDPAHITFSDKAINNWFNILEEAQKRNKVQAIINVACKDYAENAELRHIYELMRNGEQPRPDISRDDIPKVTKEVPPERLPPLVGHHVSLWLLKGGEPTDWIHLDKPITLIGRAPECDLRLGKVYYRVSRKHARIEKRGNAYILLDGDGVVKSKFGTYVNGEEIDCDSGRQLRDGDLIILGEIKEDGEGVEDGTCNLLFRIMSNGQWEEITKLLEALRTHRSNLAKLEVTKAKYGMAPPLQIINEIEDAKKEIARLTRVLTNRVMPTSLNQLRPLLYS
jgi:hypothetical protein